MKKLLVILSACFFVCFSGLFAMHYKYEKLEKETALSEKSQLDKKLVKELETKVKHFFYEGLLEGHMSGAWFVIRMDEELCGYYKNYDREAYQALNNAFQEKPIYKKQLDKLNMLHEAVAQDYNVKLIDILIKCGANVLKEDIVGKTPIDYLVDSENGEKIDKLLTKKMLEEINSDEPALKETSVVEKKIYEKQGKKKPNRMFRLEHVVEELFFDKKGSPQQRRELVQDEEEEFDFDKEFSEENMESGEDLDKQDSDEE